MRSVKDDTHKVLICLDKNSKDQLGTKSVPACPVKRHQSTHANPTVATDGKNVIACFGAEGFTVTTRPASSSDSRPRQTHSGWFYVLLPVGLRQFAGDLEVRVIVQCDVGKNSFIAAIVCDGKTLWQTPRDEISPGISYSDRWPGANGSHQLHKFLAVTIRKARSFGVWASTVRSRFRRVFRRA